MKCQGGCVSLFPADRYDFPPPDGDLEHVSSIVPRVMGTLGGAEGVTLEGREAKETEDDLPF